MHLVARLSDFISTLTNAIDNATGVRINKRPLSPENVLRALKEAGKRGPHHDPYVGLPAGGPTPISTVLSRPIPVRSWTEYQRINSFKMIDGKMSNSLAVYFNLGDILHEFAIVNSYKSEPLPDTQALIVCVNRRKNGSLDYS